MTTIGKIQRLVLFSSIVSVLFSGCGGDDFPHVTYPPVGTIFPSPDLVQELEGFSFEQTMPIEIAAMSVPKPESQIQLTVKVSGKSRSEFPGMSLHIEDSSGNAVLGAGGVLQLDSEKGVHSGVVSLLGPAKSGDYRIVVRILDVDGSESEERWKTVGSGKCVVR